MSEDKKIPGPPPPDDFSKTTPNINIAADGGGQNDWDKTNYNFPKQPAGDDWGKTVTNIRPIDTDNQDYGKTFLPGSQQSQIPQSPDWGVTNANVNVSPADFGSAPEDFGGGGGYDKTTPYFRLPEAERSKYQNLPPTPTEKAAQEKKEQEEKGGVPSWVWVGAGLFSMFLFAAAVLLFVLFFVLRDTNFEATVRLAPTGSRILVDDQQWGYSDGDSTILKNLKPGRRSIKILHPNYECKTQEVVGEAGVTPEPITARCTEIKLKAGEDCLKIGLGEVDKAERCHNSALDGLNNPFTVEDLVRALNILIVNFDSNKFDVPQERLAALQKAAGFIKRVGPDVVLEIGGHTDNVGGAESNQTLSDKRAIAVKAKLVEFGVRSEALQTRGYGATKPKTDNSTDQGKFINRRIEYSIVKK